WSILEDKDSNLWFGTNGGGVTKHDGATFTNFTTKDGPNSNNIFYILEDSKGNLWFGSDVGISKYDRITFTDFTLEEGLAENTIYSILEDQEGNMWFGTNGKGVYKYNGRTFINYTTKNDLSDNVIWSMCEDREGNIWIGTDGGVCKYGGDTFIYYTTKDGLNNNTIYSIFEDQKGNMWFGTYGGGVSKYNGRNFINYTVKDGLSDDFIMSVFEDQKGNMWFGSNSGGLIKYDGDTFTNYTTKEGLSSNSIYSIIEDQKGNMWFGTDGGGVCRYDGKTFKSFTTEDGLNNNIIMSILEDSIGNMWFGTDGGGISKYDGKMFINYTTKEGLSSNAIMCLREDKEGNIWIGTYGGGVLKHIYSNNGEPGSFETFTSEDGLCDDAVLSIVFDDTGNLWIGTNRGIDKLDISEYNKTGKKIFKHYGKEEGFIGIECNQNAVCKDSKGNIWFGTIKGVMKYNPEEDKPNTVESLTHITNLRLFFEDVDWSTYTDNISKKSGLPIDLKLPYNQNHITFDFIGISLTIPEKVRYRYMLEGFDKNWSPITKETYVTYSNLPSRKYTFNVKACNNDGLWNKKPLTYSFVIIPPFWRTWWFYLFCVISGIGMILTLINLRIGNLERRRRILEKEVDVRTRQLKEEKEKVEKIKEELEIRVNERTSELRITNKQLRKEMKDRKKAEEEKEKIHDQFLQAQKMESIGRLAGGIAHDFNNLLTTIKGYTDLSIENIKNTDLLHKFLCYINDASKRGTGLTNQLLLFSRREPIEFTSLNINEIVDDLLKMLSHLFGKNIKVNIELQSDLWMVQGNKGNIEQIIMNLEVNAKDAMPKGGKLTIKTENVTLKKKDCQTIREARPGKFVCLSVTDIGIGMDRKIIPHIFEPFFSTKEVGKGTGLGLSTVYGIIKQHKGWINVESELGKGSVFKVFLPVYSAN
ncbi:hypothetical protein KAX35_03850, partial [candidate division WOR-3 bacterium]|nr:hypothetical protein [candidate division WOR-3 bacterium]